MAGPSARCDEVSSPKAPAVCAIDTHRNPQKFAHFTGTTLMSIRCTCALCILNGTMLYGRGTGPRPPEDKGLILCRGCHRRCQSSCFNERNAMAKSELQKTHKRNSIHTFHIYVTGPQTPHPTPPHPKMGRPKSSPLGVWAPYMSRDRPGAWG